MAAPDPYPLTFEPVLVPKPWGGRRLAEFGKALPTEATFGESWDVADLPADAVATGTPSRAAIATGPMAGHYLRDAIETWGQRLLGSASATSRGDFPLLYKLLDAREHLSVQVHPDENYAEAHPEVSLKTESWYIVEADPGAVIYKGLTPGTTVDDVARAANGSGIVTMLQEIPAVPGAFHHLPAGLVHALGAGVLVAEPQTPSDTTFRLYDWTTEYHRTERELHITQALDALRTQPDGMTSLAPAERPGSRRLIATDHYWIVEHALVSASDEFTGSNELRIVAVVDGHVVLSHGNAVTTLGPGDTAVVPASISQDVLVASTIATWLEIGLAGAPSV